jgi:hypothetical protein
MRHKIRQIRIVIRNNTICKSEGVTVMLGYVAKQLI